MNRTVWAVASLAVFLSSMAAAGSSLAQESVYITSVKNSLHSIEKILGPDHPDVASTLTTLADLYALDGRYANAEPLYIRSITIIEKAMGAEHFSVAPQLEALAGMYNKQGRHNDAEVFYQRLVSNREKHLGKEHRDLAKVLKNLAELYAGQSRYADAEPLHIRALAILEKNLGSDHLDVADSLEEMAKLNISLGRRREAESLYKRTLGIKEKILGPEHAYVGFDLFHLARLYEDLGQYLDAEPLYVRSIAIMDKEFGTEKDLVAGISTVFAEMLRKQRRYSDAEPLFKRALEIREKVLGGEHPDVATSLHKLAVLSRDQNRFSEALQLFRRSLAIREKTFGPENISVADSLGNLGELLLLHEQHSDAEVLLKRTLDIREKLIGSDHPDVAEAAQILGDLYFVQGRYSESETLSKRALVIREKSFGPEHSSLAGSLVSLGLVLLSREKLAEAEIVFKRSIAIIEKAKGLEHADLSGPLTCLSAVYRSQGRYAEAALIVSRALTISEKSFGVDHLWNMNSHNILGGLYSYQGLYTEAEQSIKRALAIGERAFGADHFLVAGALSSLSFLYHSQRRFADSKPLGERALRIYENVFGLEHKQVADLSSNLAGVYWMLGMNAEAELLYRRAVNVYENSVGRLHPYLTRPLVGLMYLHEERDELLDALAYIRRATAILREHANGSSAGGGEEVKLTPLQDEKIFLAHVDLLSRLATDQDHMKNEVEAWRAEAFEVAQLARRSQTGKAVAGMAARFATGSDALAEVVRAHQDAENNRRAIDGKLNEAIGLPTEKRNLDAEGKMRQRLAEESEKVKALDARIATDFPAYAELTNPRPLTGDVTQKLLGTDEALLAFAVGETQTTVFVVRRDRLVAIPVKIERKAINGLVSVIRLAMEPEDDDTLQPFPAQTAHELYRLLLQPVVQDLEGAKTVFLVPDGPLQGLPFALLLDAPSPAETVTGPSLTQLSWLARKFGFVTLPAVSSLRALRQFAGGSSAPEPFIGIGDPLLKGHPRLSDKPAAQQKWNVRLAARRGFDPRMAARGFFGDMRSLKDQPALPETADELAQLARALNIQPSAANLVLRERAVEPVVRKNLPLANYQVVAFATHGLTAGEIPGFSEPALLLTPPDQATAEDDGLLSASEIAKLKLNADWVILSACNTAAPDGTPGAEGLSGLAKAFFYAGSRALLVSHWPVVSDTTVKLTTQIFKEAKADPTIGRAEAHRRAMLTLMGDAQYNHPIYWAPFVVVGEGGTFRPGVN